MKEGGRGNAARSFALFVFALGNPFGCVPFHLLPAMFTFYVYHFNKFVILSRRSVPAESFNSNLVSVEEKPFQGFRF